MSRESRRLQSWRDCSRLSRTIREWPTTLFTPTTIQDLPSWGFRLRGAMPRSLRRPLMHCTCHPIIFARLGLWQEDIDSNLASVAASRNASITHMGDEGHQYHAMEFLMYAYLQSGHESEAHQLIQAVRALPTMNSMYGQDKDQQAVASLRYSPDDV